MSKAIKVAKSSGGSLKAVATSCPTTFVRYGRGLRDYVNIMQFVKPRDFKTSVMVLVGPPGCGKSRHVAELVEGMSTYYKPRGPWWDGYDGHENVVIDDYYGWIAYDKLLRVCDRYPCKVHVKGSFAEFVAKWIFVTSNCHVCDWYRS